jgi:hypothetical protein
LFGSEIVIELRGEYPEQVKEATNWSFLVQRSSPLRRPYRLLARTTQETQPVLTQLGNDCMLMPFSSESPSPNLVRETETFNSRFISAESLAVPMTVEISDWARLASGISPNKQSTK